MQDILIDLVRVSHLAAFAVGIGAAVFLEAFVLKRFWSGIDREGLKLLAVGHGLIGTAVRALWITGLMLLIIRLGVLDAPFTAKLGMKLAVVSLLSANMVLIEHIVIPELARQKGRTLFMIPAQIRMRLGAIGGLSAGCWAVALLLGGVTHFSTLGALDLVAVFVPALAVATLGGALLGFALARPRLRPA